MSQPFAFALVLGWGSAAGVVALGACSALADLLVEAVLVLAGGTSALDRVGQGEGLRAWVAAMVLGMARDADAWPAS